MEDAKNTDRCLGDCIGRVVRRAINDQLAGAGNSTNTTARRKIYQPSDGNNDPLVDQNGR